MSAIGSRIQSHNLWKAGGENFHFSKGVSFEEALRNIANWAEHNNHFIHSIKFDYYVDDGLVAIVWYESNEGEIG